MNSVDSYSSSAISFNPFEDSDLNSFLSHTSSYSVHSMLQLVSMIPWPYSLRIKFFPGNCRINPFISNSNSAPRTRG